jgi:hypothetical protein
MDFLIEVIRRRHLLPVTVLHPDPLDDGQRGRLDAPRHSLRCTAFRALSDEIAIPLCESFALLLVRFELQGVQAGNQ